MKVIEKLKIVGLAVLLTFMFMMIYSQSFRGGFENELSQLFKIVGKTMEARKDNVIIGDTAGTHPITYYGNFPTAAVDSASKMDTTYTPFQTYIANYGNYAGFAYKDSENIFTELNKFPEVRFTPARTPQALVTFIFDDGNDTDSSIMAPVFITQGEVANSAIVETFVGVGVRMTWSEILYLQNLGWEIMNHTTTHPNLNTLTLDQVRVEFSTCNDSALAHGINIDNAVYPGHNNSDSVRLVAREYFRSACAGDWINEQILNTYRLERVNIDDHTELAKYEAWVDTAETTKRWLIMHAHVTDANDATAIGTLIDYIQAKNIPIVTINQGLDLIGNFTESGDAVALNEAGIRLFTNADSTYAIGWEAGYRNITGVNNIFFGRRAGYHNLTGYSNTVVGMQALQNNTTGCLNTAIGLYSLLNNTEGYENTSIGAEALYLNTIGDYNTAVGRYALYSNSEGNSNCAFGEHAIYTNTTGSFNSAFGRNALAVNTTGGANMAIGYGSLYANTDGDSILAIGYASLFSNTTGNSNVALGYKAGFSNITGSGNVFLGSLAGYNETGSNKLYIDNSDTTAPLIYGDFSNNLLRINGFLEVVDSLKASTSLWWYCKYMDAFNLSPGGSGATQIVPTANVIGGYQFNAPTEYLYFNGGVCNNWDEESDIEVKIRWEMNVASLSDNDSIFLDLDCLYKGTDEDTTKHQLLTVGVLVENLPQYTMKTTTFEIDYDLADNVVQQGDVFSFRLNLNTVRSDVDDVIINFGRFEYKTKVLQPTTY